MWNGSPHCQTHETESRTVASELGEEGVGGCCLVGPELLLDKIKSSGEESQRRLYSVSTLGAAELSVLLGVIREGLERSAKHKD